MADILALQGAPVLTARGELLQLNDMPLSKIFQRSFAAGRYPRWTGLMTSEACKFTMTMSPSYEYYDESTEVEQKFHQDLFDQTIDYLQAIQLQFASAGESPDPSNLQALLEVYPKRTTIQIAHAIYGSNMQEKAGLCFSNTLEICQAIFACEYLSADIKTIDQDYVRQVQFLITNGHCANPSPRDIIRARKEVIQHAQAFKYLLSHLLLDDDPLTEDLLLKSHTILCTGIALNPTTHTSLSDPAYAGVYRTTPAFAGATCFTPPHHTPSAMATFMKDFNKDITSRERSGSLDPWFVAADICQDFIMIHPFADGNRRLGRLLMMGFLMRFAGTVIPLGETKEGRETYLRICEVAGEGEGEERGRGMLARLVLEGVAQALGGLREVLVGSAR